jgi:hypothetical protein
VWSGVEAPQGSAVDLTDIRAILHQKTDSPKHPSRCLLAVGPDWSSIDPRWHQQLNVSGFYETTRSKARSETWVHNHWSVALLHKHRHPTSIPVQRMRGYYLHGVVKGTGYSTQALTLFSDLHQTAFTVRGHAKTKIKSSADSNSTDIRFARDVFKLRAKTFTLNGIGYKSV